MLSFVGMVLCSHWQLSARTLSMGACTAAALLFTSLSPGKRLWSTGAAVAAAAPTPPCTSALPQMPFHTSSPGWCCRHCKRCLPPARFTEIKDRYQHAASAAQGLQAVACLPSTYCVKSRNQHPVFPWPQAHVDPAMSSESLVRAACTATNPLTRQQQPEPLLTRC